MCEVNLIPLPHVFNPKVIPDIIRPIFYLIRFCQFSFGLYEFGLAAPRFATNDSRALLGLLGL